MKGKDMRVLVAEDDLTTRTILVGLLSKWGYEVQAVDDGAKAWEALQQDDSPSLALIDWVMPGMDGVDVIRKVRELRVENPPYLILLSSRDSKDDIVSGLETGANDYIK
ncbi:MAG: response regulator transcription factor, partial [Chloroflexota bacterium]